VFVDSAQGMRVLKSSNARVYDNTFYNSPVLFDRDGRSATGALFAWHPATGPDVDEREGHVFERNLLVAGEGVDGPLLEFRQAPALCGRLTRPMATRDRKGTRLNSSHVKNSYAVFCSKKKTPDHPDPYA